MRNLMLERLSFIESQCVNPQDAIIICLLMEGVEIHDLVYLKKDSLDKKNSMITIEDIQGVKIKLPVSRRCVKLFQNAIEQTKYILNNGYGLNRQNSVILRDSNFLIKVSSLDFIANESMNTEMDSVILKEIYMRVRRLAEFFSVPELAYLTTIKLELPEKAYV